LRAVVHAPDARANHTQDRPLRRQLCQGDHRGRHRSEKDRSDFSNMAELPAGLPGQGVAGLDPDPAELALVTDLETAGKWSGLADTLRKALYKASGTPIVVRDVAFISRADWIKIVDLIEIPVGTDSAPEVRPASPVEAARVWSFRRVCRLRCGSPPGDPHAVASPSLTAGSMGSSPVPGTVGPATFAAGTIKLDQVLDPTLSAAVLPLAPSFLQTLYDDYSKKYGKSPSEDVDNTPDQLASLHQVVGENRPPYADFSVYGKFGMRLVEKLVYNSFILLPSGVWQRNELEGPPTLEVWLTCWRVLRTGLLILQLVDAEVLDEYMYLISSLSERWGREVWFIIYTADKRMRRERMVRIRRESERAYAQNPLASSYDPIRPWNEVFKLARVDREFWDENCRDLAILYLGRARTAESIMSDGTIQPQLQHRPNLPERPRVLGQDKSGTGPGVSKSSGKGAGADESEKDSNGRYIKNKKGKPLCAGYQSGTCASKASGCPNGIHQCNRCLVPVRHGGNACPMDQGTNHEWKASNDRMPWQSGGKKDKKRKRN
jgi:hypothetical protein